MAIDKDIIYGVYTNTDCTEGRGEEYPIAFCWLFSTAIRLSKGKGVMGSDARIKKIDVLRIGDQRAILTEYIRVHSPTTADLAADAAKERYDETVKRLRELGVTESEIQTIARRY